MIVKNGYSISFGDNRRGVYLSNTSRGNTLNNPKKKKTINNQSSSSSSSSSSAPPEPDNSDVACLNLTAGLYKKKYEGYFYDNDDFFNSRLVSTISNGLDIGQSYQILDIGTTTQQDWYNWGFVESPQYDTPEALGLPFPSIGKGVSFFGGAPIENAGTANLGPVLVSESVSSQIDDSYSQAQGQNNKSLIIKGYFKPTVNGVYKFRLYSDDASYLWFGNNALDGNRITADAVVSLPGIHGPYHAEGTFTMVANSYYPLTVEFGNGPDGEGVLIFDYMPPGSDTWTSDLSGKLFYDVDSKGHGVCNIDNMFLPSLWLKADAGVTLEISQIIVSGFTGTYIGANGTYNYDGENAYYHSASAYYITSNGQLIDDSNDGVVIATNSNNFQGAWSAGNYFSTITFSNAGEDSIDMNGVYTRSNELSSDASFTASGGRSISYDDNDGFWYTNGDLYRNYGTSLNVGDWTTENGDEPSPTAVNSTSVRNVGSPTSTTVVAITDWEDQSENGNNATAPDTYPTFIASSINSKPAISFNNDGSFMQIPENNIGNDGNISIFVVLNYSAGAILLNKGDAATFAQTVWEITTSNGFGFVDNVESWNTVPISIPQDVPVLLEAFSSAGVSQIAYNGTNSGSPSTANGNFNSLSQYIGIGGGGTNGQSTTSLDARIAEIIIYNRSLNTSERQEVENYLANKYEIFTVFNNTFNSTVDSQNTTWDQGPNQEITTAPAGCPNSNCLHLLQGQAGSSALYSQQALGQLGMLDLTKSYTIECWFYVTDIYAENGSFLFLRADGGDPIGIGFNGDRSITVFTNPDSFTTNSSIFNLNSWNHFAITVNQSLGKTTVYINGVNCGEMNHTTNLPDLARWEWGVGHDFSNGYDIYISNMRWSQTALYNSNFTPTFTNFPNALL